MNIAFRLLQELDCAQQTFHRLFFSNVFVIAKSVTFHIVAMGD
ncbi:hypothetical protein BvCmsOUNP037_01763 [Escherichia coli]|nr:hypothetical protein BvCmsOUNP037_01763 [Escherichia coli]